MGRGGRPRVPWTASRRRKLARLYLFTPMHLKDICAVLRDGEFRPVPRKTQEILSELFQSNYKHFRPKDRNGMKKRMAGLRRCRRIDPRRPCGRTSVSPSGSSLIETAKTSNRTFVPGSADISKVSTGTPISANVSEDALPNPCEFCGFTPNLRSNTVPPLDAAYVAHGCNQASNPSVATSRSDGKRPASSELTPSASKSARICSLGTMTSETDDRLKLVLARSDSRALSDLASRTSLMARLSWKYSSSYIEEIISLRSRFSMSTTSWRSSRVSSLASASRSFSTAKKGPRKPSAVEQTVLQQSSVTSELHLCWCGADDCLHVQVSKITSSCPSNLSSPPSIHGLKIYAMDPFKNISLHLAAIEPATFPVFDALIRANADIHAVSAGGETFMHVLDPTKLLQESGCYFPRLLSLLRQRNFGFHTRDHRGKTVLLSLLQDRGLCDRPDILSDRPDILSAFSKYLVDEEDLWLMSGARDNFGLTPETYLAALIERTTGVEGLGWARECYLRLHRKCLEITGLSETPAIGLLSSGAVSLRRTNRTLTPFFEKPGSQEDGSPSTLHELALDASWPSTRPYFMARWGRLTELVRAGFDINAYNNAGFTPLMLLTAGKRAEDTNPDTGALVEAFISNGAIVHQRDWRDRTALHMAVENGKMAATDVLLRKGAKVNARTGRGQSVLTVAHKALKRAKKKGELHTRIMACVTMLIDNGAVAEPRPQQEWA